MHDNKVELGPTMKLQNVVVMSKGVHESKKKRGIKAALVCALLQATHLLTTVSEARSVFFFECGSSPKSLFSQKQRRSITAQGICKHSQRKFANEHKLSSQQMNVAFMKHYESVLTCAAVSHTASGPTAGTPSRSGFKAAVHLRSLPAPTITDAL